VTAASAAIHPVVDGPVRVVHVLATQGGQAVLGVDGLADVVTVERSGGPQLPCAIEGTVHGSQPGDEGLIGAGQLVIGDIELAPIRWWDPRPRVAVPDAARVHDLTSRWDPPGDGELAEAVERAVGRGEVAGLVGLGDGMTPAGDDWLIGRLGTLTAFGALTAAAKLWTAIFERLGDTTPLAATMLRHASLADVPMGVHDLIRFLGGARSLDGEDVLERLGRVGASSGRWWVTGVLDAAAELVGS